MIRDDIFHSHMIRNIYSIGVAYKSFLRNCNDMWRAKYINRLHLYDYVDTSKASKRIDTIVPGIYDIQLLAVHYDPVETISNKGGNERFGIYLPEDI